MGTSEVKLRDRDAIVTADGIIFRVYGYIHPPHAYVCDPEYVSTEVFQSTNPRARRGINKPLYYKFFADEGLKFILKEYPKYTVFHEPLVKRLVGVNKKDIREARRPDIELPKLLANKPEDMLHMALQNLFELVSSNSGLTARDFGVFGSLLHGFYHPDFSDLDFIVYGREKLGKLSEALEDLYPRDDSLSNEFDSIKAVEGKNWMFLNYSLEEYLWHQRRKMIYCLFKTRERVVKAEFEPVKEWREICNEYDKDTRITNVGWIKAVAEITGDDDASFIPSIYQIEIRDILEGPKIDDVKRIFSYMEEFRMQVKRGEQVLVEGNLEKVVTRNKVFHQITLSYGPRYYEQTLKVIKPQ
jgi:predicted nucleotidyltransferase